MQHDGLVSRVEPKRVDLLLGDPRGIRHGGSYAALVDRRVVADDVGRGVASGECVQHDGHENASAADTWLPMAHGLVDRDEVSSWSVVTPPVWSAALDPDVCRPSLRSAPRPAQLSGVLISGSAQAPMIMYYDILVWRSTVRRDATAFGTRTFDTPPITPLSWSISTRTPTLRRCSQSDPTELGTSSR